MTPIGIVANAPKAMATKVLNHRFIHRLAIIDTGIINQEAATKTNNIVMKYIKKCMRKSFETPLST